MDGQIIILTSLIFAFSTFTLAQLIYLNHREESLISRYKTILNKNKNTEETFIKSFIKKLIRSLMKRLWPAKKHPNTSGES